MGEGDSKLVIMRAFQLFDDHDETVGLPDCCSFVLQRVESAVNTRAPTNTIPATCTCLRKTKIVSLVPSTS